MRLVVLAYFLAISCIASAQTAGVAASPQAPGQREEWSAPGVAGTISKISGDTVVLKTFEDRSVTVKMTDQTRFRKDRQPAKLSDFKVGDSVMVRGEKNGEDTITAAMLMTRSGTGMLGGLTREQMREKMGKEIIAGELKGIDGLKLTILRVDGETQTIAVDENTSFRKRGESVTLADLNPGDRVFGRGQIKDGVFVPSILNVGEPWMRGTAPASVVPEAH